PATPAPHPRPASRPRIPAPHPGRAPPTRISAALPRPASRPRSRSPRPGFPDPATLGRIPAAQPKINTTAQQLWAGSAPTTTTVAQWCGSWARDGGRGGTGRGAGVGGRGDGSGGAEGLQGGDPLLQLRDRGLRARRAAAEAPQLRVDLAVGQPGAV